MKKQLRLTLSQKGGVGKTAIAVNLASWCLHHKIKFICIDGDPSNSSLGDYNPGLPVRTIEILNDSGMEIDISKFDSLVYFWLDQVQDEDIVIFDTGATTFNPLVAFLKTNQIFSLLQDKYEIHLDIVVAPGEALADTLNSMIYVTELFHEDGCKINVWVNEWFGEVRDTQGRVFEDTPEYNKIKSALNSIIYLREPPSSLHRNAITKMKQEKLTYLQIKDREDFMLLDKSRIHSMMVDNIFKMMDQIFDIPSSSKTKSSNKEEVSA